jgi:hypothetical protein
MVISPSNVLLRKKSNGGVEEEAGARWTAAVQIRRGSAEESSGRRGRGRRRSWGKNG